MCNNPKLLESISNKLDKKSGATKNWKHLGTELQLTKNDLDDLESGSNPTLALMEYIYVKQPNVTVENFWQIMQNLTRNDVLQILKQLEIG